MKRAAQHRVYLSTNSLLPSEKKNSLSNKDIRPSAALPSNGIHVFLFIMLGDYIHSPVVLHFTLDVI